MNTKRTLAALLCTTALAAAQAPFAYHFEFDQPGVLPDATPGIGAFNATSTPTSTSCRCGRTTRSAFATASASSTAPRTVGVGQAPPVAKPQGWDLPHRYLTG